METTTELFTLCVFGFVYCINHLFCGSSGFPDLLMLFSALLLPEGTCMNSSSTSAWLNYMLLATATGVITENSRTWIAIDVWMTSVYRHRCFDFYIERQLFTLSVIEDRCYLHRVNSGR